MKRYALAICLVLVALDAHARGIRDDVDMVGDQARTSYAFGMTVGSDLKETGLALDFAAFTEGLIAAMDGDPDALRMDRQDALELVQAAFERAAEGRADRLRVEEELFLAANAQVPGVNVTESGLQYSVIEEGTGPKPTSGDTVMVHYEGTLVDGTVFDSSRARGFPEPIPLEMVIPGWAEGIQLMNVGGTYRFYIPSDLAYGSRGAGQVIPPFATLIFTVELLEIMGDEASGD
jgi:FKBP-type peptidyl-prolyl cis-trans isomerase